MKTIVLFGAGKSATVLIEYLVSNAAQYNWQVVIGDADKDLITSKTQNALLTEAIQLDINNSAERAALITRADIVISLMPPTLHYLIADDCITLGKNLLTASYIDDQIKSRKDEIESKGLLFLCEMGLDPGIDHMSAMQLINTIKGKGGNITSFKSHCGGLVAPESDTNPWHYKISWNPRNVVMAGKAGAIYKINNLIVKENYEELFDVTRNVTSTEGILYAYYPNRDSLNYIETYQLPDAATFMRTTLRYPEFVYGWNNLIELKLTDEEVVYNTDGVSICNFFLQHMTKVDFENWSKKKIEANVLMGKEMAEKLELLNAKEKEFLEEGTPFEEFSVVNEKGEMEIITVEAVKQKLVYAIGQNVREINTMLGQLFYLGLRDEETMINKGKCSAADVLQFVLENKLALLPDDKDMVVMLHEIAYRLDGRNYETRSELIVKGKDGTHTAMAATVGLPLGIATKLILDGTINLKGLHIPIVKEIYEPVLAELEKNDIIFKENTI